MALAHQLSLLCVPLKMLSETLRGSELASGFISSIGNILETTIHAVGNVGVTAMMEASRVLTTTAVGIRQTIGSAMSGTAPDFTEQQKKEHEFRQSR